MKESIENPKNWENIELKTVQFFFEQSEKYLVETTETAKSLTERSVTIMQFSIALSLALVGILFSKGLNPLLYHLSFMGLISGIIVSRKCLTVFKLYEIYTIGNSPSHLMNREKMKFSGDDQLKVSLISALITMQGSIEFNENENLKRANILNSVLRVITTSGVIVSLYTILWYPVFQSVFESLAGGQG